MLYLSNIWLSAEQRQIELKLSSQIPFIKWNLISLKKAYLAAERVVMLAIMFQTIYNICRAYLK